MIGLRVTAEQEASYVDLLFLQVDLYEPVVNLLTKQVKNKVLTEAVQFIGVLCGKDKCKHVSEFIKHDICLALQTLLTNDESIKLKSETRNMIYFLISNIAADKDTKAVQSLINSGLISSVNLACQK